MINTRWPEVPLGELLTHRKNFITIDDRQSYKRCRVQLAARGIVLRDIVSGSDIKTKEQQVCKAGEFLVAEIDAKVGGYGMVPDNLSGAIVSSHYFLFTIKEQRLSQGFLRWYARTARFFQQVAAQGSTNYAAIRPHHVLGYTIPLPSLAEQDRIVSQLDASAKCVEDRTRVADAMHTDLGKLLGAGFEKVTAGAPRIRMSDLAPLVRRPIDIDPDGTYLELGVRSFGKGTFHKPELSGLEIGTKRIFRIEKGDLLFNIVFAWEGAVAVAKEEDSGRVGSHRFLTCVPDPRRATAEFLRYFFLTDEGLKRLGEASPGGAGRNRTLGLQALNAIEVPAPSAQAQQWFDELQAKAAVARTHSAEAAAEVGRLIPAMLNQVF
jgi:type I restriction enzyme S subunit